ncbi:MAG: fibronectin type III [Flavobacteriaceae bacterium]|jgi:hypothetical protein|nr:fibronectin type III [Flavobacteriaceae bacterium]
MKKKIHCFSLTFFCILGFSNLTAQTGSASVFVNARAQQDKIVIRWAVDAPVEWQKSNKNGFVLYKMLIKQNEKLVDNPERKQISVLKAEPLEKWMDFIQKDNYGAIIAQALYGESFEVEQKSKSKVAAIINMAEELSQRHSFALFAADLSFEGALKAGWGYVDKEVKKGEVYAYQVEAYQMSNVNPGAYMIGLSDYEELPKVSDFTAIPDDGQVMLSWGIERLKNTYTSYMIERSEDGKNYTPVSSTTIVDVSSNSEKSSKQMFFGNKLEANNKEYYFRIYGINSFGEKGPYSDVIKTQGLPSVIVAPRIINYTVPNSEEVELEWEFPKEEEKNIKGFELYHAEKDLSDYKAVAKEIDRTQRKYRYKGLASSNYFKVAVLDNQDRKLLSQSALVQPVDSVPPAKPLGLEGKIDSLGHVVLKWKANSEKDMAGYRVLRANAENEEFVDLFNRIVPETIAKDSVSFAISNKKVYYRLIAEDLRYNRSEFSEILVIEKPDRIAPTAPVFKNYETVGGKNTLVWINSSSDDIEKHYLKRRLKGEITWTDIGSFTKNETQYTDESTEADKTYEYLIQAKDKSGLWSSEESSVLTITTLDNTPVAVLKNVELVIDRNKKTASLYWNYDTKYTVSEIQIYKNKKGEKPSLWKVLDGKFLSITDKDLNMNTEYEYYLLPYIDSQKPAKGEKLNLTY